MANLPKGLLKSPLDTSKKLKFRPVSLCFNCRLIGVNLLGGTPTADDDDPMIRCGMSTNLIRFAIKPAANWVTFLT